MSKILESLPLPEFRMCCATRPHVPFTPASRCNSKKALSPRLPCLLAQVKIQNCERKYAGLVKNYSNGKSKYAGPSKNIKLLRENLLDQEFGHEFCEHVSEQTRHKKQRTVRSPFLSTLSHLYFLAI